VIGPDPCLASTLKEVLESFMLEGVNDDELTPPTIVMCNVTDFNVYEALTLIRWISTQSTFSVQLIRFH
jgi:hypothetical protein